jgi:hypothetical protein
MDSLLKPLRGIELLALLAEELTLQVIQLAGEVVDLGQQRQHKPASRKTETTRPKAALSAAAPIRRTLPDVRTSSSAAVLRGIETSMNGARGSFCLSDPDATVRVNCLRQK